MDDFFQWLIDEKHMSVRSAKDVLSRRGRIYRMLNIEELDDYSINKLANCNQFQESSIFIKSQLKRTVTLCLEYSNQSKEG
ncbi:MAG TPA: hypothetical protein VFD52_08125 [Clostridia bacterium]|nr:hypothetical protein [Clostridia bacterium]